MTVVGNKHEQQPVALGHSLTDVCLIERKQSVALTVPVRFGV